MEISFLFFEKANYPAAQPVMRMLHSQSSHRPVFVKGFDFKEHSGSITPLDPVEDFETLDIHGFVHERDVKDAAVTAARHREQLLGLAPDERFESRAAHRLFQRELNRPWMPVVMREVEIIRAALARFHQQRRPRIVVLPEDTDYVRGRLAAKLLREAGTFVVVLAPSFYGMFLRYPLVGSRYAGHYLAMNAVLRDRLLRAGVAADQISVVGNPAFDALCAVRIGNHAPRVFLFAAQGLDSDRHVIADLISIFRRLPEDRLLLKPHPESGARAWEGLLGDLPNVRLLPEPISIPRLLEQVSCVIAQTSTLLYQAIVVGLPVIVPHYTPGPVAIHLPPEVAAGAVASGQSALERLVRQMSAGTLPQSSPEGIQPAGFRATENVVRRLEELCAAL